MDRDVFNPFKGSEASILSTVPIKGGVYFATDTKRIFYSDGESFLPMGGNTGVWYGTMQYAETPEVGQTIFEFNPDEIEGNEDNEEGKYNLPNINDLIFNNPDGCFYRVIDKDSSIITCKKLTVSGGGGGGGSSSGSGTMVVSRIGSQTVNTLYGTSCIIKYKFIAKDAADEETGPGQASLQVNGIIQNTFVAMQGENEIDVSPYLEIGTNQIKLIVSGNTGGIFDEPPQTKTWTVIATRLDLTWNYNETTINSNENFEMSWSVSSTLPHTAHIVLPTGTIDDNITSLREGSILINREEYNLRHGSYLIGIYVTAEIGGQTFTSNTIWHKVIFVGENIGDTIISIGLVDDVVDQYNTLSIPIIIYDPNSGDGKVSAILREDGIDKDSWIDYNNATQYYWNYTPTTSGQKTLDIISNSKKETLRITVNDLGLLISEVPGYDFKFKASDLVSNNSLQNWTYNTNISPIFSEGFDWINGGLKTEKDENNNNRQLVRIKAGNTMSFNNYYPLYNVTDNTGFSIKVIFKISNCRTYDAQGIIIGNKTTDNSYIILNANEATFKTQLNTITVPYCEDTYLELEFDIWDDEAGQPYIMTWLDGVPAGVIEYEASDSFYNNNGIITIGSEDCDVDLYLIKVYKKHLDTDGHVSNFILDASNSNDIIARYNRNNILDENDEISYSKLIEKNPNAEVYLYDIKRMTTTKKDKVTGCKYRRYKGQQNALQTAENVEMAVQGTSSAAYGLAAFNFNSTFTEGFTDYTKNAEGEHIDNWAMTKDSIPINDFNTKVNVASCEGTNNAINQAWYDKLVNHVFVTEYKHKNPKSRHTMEFNGMGVVFIRDENQITNAENGVNNNIFKDTDGYIKNPYYKMYSICNMGNIKRNEGVFSDPENPYDVIMEVSDNQSVYQQMTGVLTEDENQTSIKGRWIGDKFYPILTTATYVKTLDEKAQSGKEYFIRTGNENNYTYIKVTNITIGETNVSSYYEYVEAGGFDTTEVFEWRAVPEDTWNIIKNNPNDGRNMREQAENAWTSLVAWFARNNPNAATGLPLESPETYDEYIFKGYTSASGRLDKNGNPMDVYEPSSILKNLKIATYAGEYTHDTYERRMAKMLFECENHLIMDEIVFHYLFIERHTLIDNVAKNTFWHTEDLQHWSMIKDYDNDTSDGNDNSGHLTLTYGYEVLDKVGHSTESNASYVFNAPTSVWLHFINGLLEARTRMYQALDTSEIKAWDAQPYLDEFNKWQSALPERVWIEDYYRKYLRPKEVYNATQFLPMLEGGKKTHQRKQFEIYQEAYMSSEYQGRLCANSIIDIRANGQNIRSKIFPISMYSDCYIRIAAGSGQDPNVRIRAKRGETYNISLPRDDANDMTTYIYLANYVTSLSGIEQLLPKKIDISQARRLREFSMTTLKATADAYVLASTQGSYDASETYYIPNVAEVSEPAAANMSSYYEKINNEYVPTEDESPNNEKTYYIFVDNSERFIEVITNDESEFETYFVLTASTANINLRQAVFTSNTMLEKLILQNCPLISNGLDLTNCTNLKYLDIKDSGFTGISLPSNAPLETLYLNKPVSLSMKNLYRIQNYSCQGYERLTGLYLDNVDQSVNFNSKDDILDQASLSNILQLGKLQYNLQNINWTISEANEIDYPAINLLDSLLNQIPFSIEERHPFDNHTMALSGLLTIESSAYNNSNSINIYNAYINNSTYPNLELEFEGNNAKLFNVNILDGDGKIIWSRQANNSNKLNNDFYSGGPNGALSNLIDIITDKTETMETTYTFNNNWIIKSDNPLQTDRQITNSQYPIDTENFILSNLTIEPQFDEEVHVYTVNFFNGDQLITSNTYEYGRKINTILPIDIPEKDDSNLDFYETYAFLGWSSSPNSTKVLSLTDDRIVNDDLNYYAVFSDVINPCDSRNVHLSNFKFSLTDFTDNYDPTNYSIAEGYEVEPADDVKLIGKITIPARYNGLPVIKISNFTQSKTKGLVSGVYFENGTEIENKTQIRVIESSCFLNNTGIQHVEMPDSLRVIEGSAFQGAINLKLSKNKSNNIYQLGGNNTYQIGNNAFNQSLSNDCEIIIIPGSVRDLGSRSFSFPDGSMHLYKIDIGDPDHPSQLKTKPITVYDHSPLDFNDTPKIPSGITIYLSNNNPISDEDYREYLIYHLSHLENNPITLHIERS